MPRQLGPTIRMPPRRAISVMRVCRAAPSAPASAKPEENTTADLTPWPAQASSAAGTRAAGTATIAQVDGARGRLDRGIGLQALDRVPVWVDRVDRPFEAGLEHVAQRPPADARGIGRGPENGHRARLEQRPQIGHGCGFASLWGHGIGHSGLPVGGARRSRAPVFLA